MGEKTFTAYTDEGHIRQMVASATDVEDALLSVPNIVKVGNRVVFGGTGSYIEHKITGEVTPLIEQRGLYKLKIWVPKDQPHPF